MQVKTKFFALLFSSAYIFQTLCSKKLRYCANYLT